MIRRLLPWLALAVVAAIALAMAAGPDVGDGSPEARTESIAARLRCPVCQGLSVADSPSDTARAIRDDVRRRVDEGESDDEILRAYVDRFGDWVLLAPEASGIGTVVWALPIAVIAVGGAALTLAFRRWRRRPAMHATDADRDLVERALAGRPEDARTREEAR